MSDSYTKLFSSITESTIWGEPAGTRLVWITMLAKCNRRGEFFGSIPGLARLANVTLAECESALQTLLAPDRWSRTPEFEGRRIEAIDRGWLILNHAKFDRLRSEIEAEERERERKRDWDRENRPSGYARSKEQKSDESPTQSDGGPMQSVAPPAATVVKSEEPKRQASKRGSRLPDGWRPADSVIAWAKSKYPSVDLNLALEEFSDFWRGVPGAKGCNLDWNATFRNRIRKLFEYRNSHGNRSSSRKPGSLESVEIACEADRQREAELFRAHG